MSYQQIFSLFSLLYISYCVGFEHQYDVTGTVLVFNATANGGKGDYMPRSYDENFATVQFIVNMEHFGPEAHPDSNGNFSFSVGLERDYEDDTVLEIAYGFPEVNFVSDENDFVDYIFNFSKRMLLEIVRVSISHKLGYVLRFLEADFGKKIFSK